MLSRERRGHAVYADWILRIGIAANLGLLGYYKYANFFVQNIDCAFNLEWQIDTVILPLGISFFTFTQIAFLVDAYRGEVKEANFIYYGLFVTYFPHLIAGPVLHHKEMIPQFDHPSTYKGSWENLSIGLTIFSIGLFKKVVLADGVAPYATLVFENAAAGETLTIIEAWSGALAYTFQLYFDFSGYSDMAIGSSRVFGIKLPLNFNSPYKAVNIIEFWRRWHITLSRFLRDYLYFSLGGNRNGSLRRYFNLMVTMLLGGLWHGAGWTFIVWGGLHGLFLIINHCWQKLRRRIGHEVKHSSRLGRVSSTLLTFVAVVVAWIFFRAQNIGAAFCILKGLIGYNELIMPEGLLPEYLVRMLSTMGTHFGELSTIKEIPGGLGSMAAWFTASFAIVWLAPNTQQIMLKFKPFLKTVNSTSRVHWQPNWMWMIITIFVLLFSFERMGRVSEFLYFQF